MFWGKENKIRGRMILEEDVSKFVKRKYNRGHRVEGVWIVGIVKRSANRNILFFIFKNRKKNTQ
ncbi:hypothetical protein COBT_001936 [Conglomerata obtusa]